MKRKGISPLIAAVLLIAFTMAVASIFAQWAPQLIQDAQGDTSDRADEIQSCSDRTMEVDVDTTNNSATIQQTGGTEGIGNLTVTWQWEANDATQNSTNATTDIDSSRGITTIDSGYSGRNLIEVEVQPTDCQGAPSATWEAE
ncbi:MAG: flagellin-like protein [Candidatus Nanohaloarchaea archaeon]|jgi:flagellin-like protein